MRHALRDYQRRAVDGLLAALDRRPILVAPTGGGKTTIASALVERLGVQRQLVEPVPFLGPRQRELAVVEPGRFLGQLVVRLGR